jgi:predicted nucleotidyltransferase
MTAVEMLPAASEGLLDSRVFEYVHLLGCAAIPELKQVVLFGSRAMQRARRDSDYDIALFVEGAVSKTAILAIATKLSYPFVLAGFDIRPVVIDVARWNEDSEFLDHIRSFGRMLYEADRR